MTTPSAGQINSAMEKKTQIRLLYIYVVFKDEYIPKRAISATANLAPCPQQGVAIRQMYYYDFTATDHPLCKFRNKICFTQFN